MSASRLLALPCLATTHQTGGMLFGTVRLARFRVWCGTRRVAWFACSGPPNTPREWSLRLRALRSTRTRGWPTHSAGQRRFAIGSTFKPLTSIPINRNFRSCKPSEKLLDPETLCDNLGDFLRKIYPPDLSFCPSAALQKRLYSSLYAHFYALQLNKNPTSSGHIYSWKSPYLTTTNLWR